MKITIVLGPFHPIPPWGYGAVEKVWFELGRELAGRGHEVHIIGKGSGVTSGSTRLKMTVLKGFKATGVLPLDLVKDLLYAVHVCWLVPKSDVVISNTFWLPVFLSVLKKLKGRLVVHVGRFPKGQLFLYKGADLIHTVSTSVAEAIALECPELRSKTAVLGYPVDTDVFSPSIGRQTRTPSILYVGRIHPEKGVHLLVRAFRLIAQKFPSVTLTIIGPTETAAGGGGPKYQRLLERDAQSLPVRFEPPIRDQPLLASRLADATVFCYPSLAERGETFGRAVLEAMSCGAACVVSSLPCFEDFITNGENGLVFEHRGEDPARLAEAINFLLTHPDKIASIGVCASKTAAAYSLHRMAGLYADMLASLTSSTAKTRL